MTTARTPSPIAEERRRTLITQAQAADPTGSAWVAANAGTGKTHVLTNRVLRILLLKDAKPDRILCLTYTKAAAAEMAARVFGVLAGWVTMRPDDLENALRDLLTRTPTAEEMARARTLFAVAIETPGGLKVQTIHAFCEQLLQRFPLEAGVPPGFEVLDDETAAALRREATDDMLAAATRKPDSPLGRALTTAIAYAAEDGFDEKLKQALGKRDWIEAATRVDDGTAADDPWAAAMATLKRACQVRPDADRDAIEREICGLLPDAVLARLEAALAEGSSNDQKMADAIATVLAAAAPTLRCTALARLLLTKDGEPKKERTLATQAVQKAAPDVLPTLQAAQARFLALDAERRSLDVIDATLALLRLADAVLGRYTDLKARRAGLDFEDLIRRASRLLQDSGAAQWVLYKLDGGLDHILVDESQDTSPDQWRIIEALANEFYAGTGQSETQRTVFAVGDEKQSIYSFQGAAPEQFAAKGQQFAGMASRARQPFRPLSLTLSFRTVAPVLQAVDLVFSDPARTPGVGGREPVRHNAHRDGHGGSVEIWQPEPHQEPEATAPFAPLAETSVSSPAARLANRIAATIRGWLDTGEMLTSENRPVRAGDILVLVRRRRPFAPQIVAALKARGIAVAGADRIRLTEQIAVEDLMALGDFLVVPEDDLALATVLKSPLIGLDDDDLMELAPERRGTLWNALLAAAPGRSSWQTAAEQLKTWRRRADLSPPFEFFAELLDRDKGRTKLLSRLGPDAADPIDEFLNLALSYDEREPPSLVGFLDWLRRSEREIKRDMEHGRDEVRVMTVHGAKGLEAPIVFLPDTCSAAAARPGNDLLELTGTPMPIGFPPPLIWPIKGSRTLAVVKTARDRQADREREEYNRLLYVAMTRARDRLYVAGFEGKRSPPQHCWYNLVRDGLEGQLTEHEAGDGAKAWRLAAPQQAAPESPKRSLVGGADAVDLPDWARRAAPREPHLAVPIAPSRFVPYEVDDEGEPAEAARPAGDKSRAERAPAEPSPVQLAADNRFLRGTLTHALLEHLPGIPEREWKRAAEAFLAARGPTLRPRQRASIASETLAVLAGSDFRALFGPQSRAEVPIAAMIPDPTGRHPPLRLTGQIDRLARVGEQVLIVDYKTNRPPPSDAPDVAEAYLYQLAAYRLAVQQIYPALKVRAAILWTDGPRLMPIPDELLEVRQSRLWELHPGRLDADTAPP